MREWWEDPEVSRVAGAVGRRFRGYVDVEDLRSELVLWCFEHPQMAERLWSQSTPWWFKHRRLWTIAERHARQQKAIALGHEIADEFFYSPYILKQILPDAFDGEATPLASPTISDAKTKRMAGPGGEWETIVSDVRRALSSISDKDFELLWAVYGEVGGSLGAYAVGKGWDWRRAVRAEGQALRRLVDLLGGPTPWNEDLESLPEQARKGPSEPRTATKTPEPIHG